LLLLGIYLLQRLVQVDLCLPSLPIQYVGSTPPRNLAQVSKCLGGDQANGV
jgi:hypothetical protein